MRPIPSLSFFLSFFSEKSLSSAEKGEKKGSVGKPLNQPNFYFRVKDSAQSDANLVFSKAWLKIHIILVKSFLTDDCSRYKGTATTLGS